MLVIFIAGVEHILPYHVPAETAPVAVPAPHKPPADCLPSGTGGPCISFDKIQEMINGGPVAPKVLPPNPATADEEKI